MNTQVEDPGSPADPDPRPPSFPSTDRSNRRHGGWLGRSIRELLETIVPAVLIALLINIFVGQATRVEGQSMEPSLHSEQRLVVEKLSYRFHGPRRFDVVVLRMASQGEELLIKRVIGLPGETVEIRDGRVYIDNRPLDESFVSQPTREMGQHHGPVYVPPLHVFVLGDNRNHSNDSRSFGVVPIEAIVGRAWISYWPPADAGPVE